MLNEEDDSFELQRINEEECEFDDDEINKWHHRVVLYALHPPPASSRCTTLHSIYGLLACSLSNKSKGASQLISR
jgi:hypothetical protein